MANGKLKIRSSSGWDLIHPETNLDQISDMSVAGRAIAKLGDPGAEGFLKVTTEGVPTVVATASVRSAIGAAENVHTHAISDINTLVATLAAKADLSNGTIKSTQVPSWILGGLKYVQAINTVTIEINDANRAIWGMTSDATTKGRYLIVTVSCAVTLGANHIFTTGDEQSMSNVTLEPGDWIVFRGLNGTNYEFDIINNTYRSADVNIPGVVSLASGTSTTRAALQSSSNPAFVVDEYALKQVMKGIYYAASEAAVDSPMTGDLLIEIQ